MTQPAFLGRRLGVIASMQAAVAIRILCARHGAEGTDQDGVGNGVPLKLTMVDVWDQSFRQIDVSNLRENSGCPACHRGERLWLNGNQASGSTILCGRNAVQVSPAEKISVSLEELANRLDSAGRVTSNPFLIRVAIQDSDLEMTVFPDGRAIVKGTEDPAVARAAYSRYVGT